MSMERVGQYLLRQKILEPAAWDQLSQEFGSQKNQAIQEMVKRQIIDQRQGYAAYAYSNAWSYESLDGRARIPDAVLELVEPADAREHQIIPLDANAQRVLVATARPNDMTLAQQLRANTKGIAVEFVYSSPGELKRAVETYYSTANEARKVGREAAESVTATEAQTATTAFNVVEDSEFVRLLDVILEGAFRVRASDVHLEPSQTMLRVRYTVDNELVEQTPHSTSVGRRMVALVKTRAKLGSDDIVAKNGGFPFKYDGSERDIRVAVMPGVWGEAVTMRLSTSQVQTLDRIGFSSDVLERWESALENPNGIFLAVGPMGCGKTTLNYATGGHYMKQGKKIVTLEDPVEIRVPEGMTQVSINEGQGLTWEDGMATLLRMRANVLILGEINRKPIAHTAMEAAQQGHIVLSTLHTNDAPGTVIRLRQMGVMPSVLADGLRAVCAQRLPRRLCEACKAPKPPTERQIRDFGLTPEDLASTEWFGPGTKDCEKCQNERYRGVVPIHELMTFPAEIQELITESAPSSAIAAAARKHGMRPLKEDGLNRVRAGDSSLEEVRRHILIN